MQSTVYFNTKDYTWNISLLQDMNQTKLELQVKTQLLICQPGELKLKGTV